MSKHTHDLKSHQIEMLALAKAAHPKLATLTDHRVCDLYREWSNWTAATDWMTPSPTLIAEFAEWATTAPCDSE